MSGEKFDPHGATPVDQRRERTDEVWPPPLTVPRTVGANGNGHDGHEDLAQHRRHIEELGRSLVYVERKADAALLEINGKGSELGLRGLLIRITERFDAFNKAETTRLEEAKEAESAFRSRVLWLLAIGMGSLLYMAVRAGG